MYMRELPPINRSTLIYLARFYHEVSTYSEDNLMTTYNLAVIITPNLFRSEKLEPTDLLRHGTLTDVFTLIMNNTERVIADISKEESNADSLVNNIMNNQAPNLAQLG